MRPCTKERCEKFRRWRFQDEESVNDEFIAPQVQFRGKTGVRRVRSEMKKLPEQWNKASKGLHWDQSGRSLGGKTWEAQWLEGQQGATRVSLPEALEEDLPVNRCCKQQGGWQQVVFETDSKVALETNRQRSDALADRSRNPRTQAQTEEDFTNSG